MSADDVREGGPTATAPPRIVAIADDPLLRDALTQLFSTEPRFTLRATSGLAADDADLVLLDSRIAGSLAFCAAIWDTRRVPVIFLAAPDDETWGAEALHAGARGILTRRAAAPDLLAAVEAVCSGVIWAPRRLISRLVDHLKGAPAIAVPETRQLEECLSIREREIFHHAARGLGNKELAAQFAISEATVKVHLTHIFQKLGVRGRSELAAAYYGIAMPATHDAQRLPVRRGGVSPTSAHSPIIRKS